MVRFFRRYPRRNDKQTRGSCLARDAPGVVSIDLWALVVPSLAEPGQPVLETHGAEPGILARRERAIVQFCSEIASMDVGDDLARVFCRGQILPGEVIETERFRSGQLNDAVDRTAERDVGQGGSDVVRGHGLKQGRRQPDDLSIRRRIDDPADELEELGRARDREGNLRGLDQAFLHQLGAEITVFPKAVDSDNRQRYVVAY